MINIEVRGIPCVWNDEAMNDMTILEYVWTMDSGNISALVPFSKAVFGEEQYSNIKEQLAMDNGVCGVDIFQDFVMECMAAASEAKRVEAKN